MNTVTTVRRTLPAPHEVVDVEALRAERDRLLVENSGLREEIARLRETSRRVEPSASELRMPAPSPVPRDLPFDLPSTTALFTPGDVPTGGPKAAEPIANGGLDFGTVARLSPSELDQLPYGLICLDAQGRVVQYNDTESRLARLPKERVIGRNFFAEVAPCTRVREFEGQFYELVRDPSRVRVRSFDFVFRFRHSEQHVTIVLTPARTRGLYNMALLRRSVTPR